MNEKPEGSVQRGNRQKTTKEKEEVPAEIERELMERTRAGDKAAFGQIVTAYMRRAYFTALAFVQDHEAARDLSQEAFIRAYRHRNRFETHRRFFTWYYQILRNLCLNYCRDRARHAAPFSQLSPGSLRAVSDPRIPADEALELQERRQVVWAAIQALKEQDREIILLKDFQEYSYKEIAELLQCPLGTVMSRLYSARKALKQKVARYFHETKQE